MNFFIVAGEASGDLHASNLMKALKAKNANVDYDFIGGDLMSKVAGKPPVSHYRDMNFMGLFTVILHIFTIRAILRKAQKLLIAKKPDGVILVDYAGFNLRLAKFAASKGLKVFYYISPKVWAWRESRVQKMKKYIDKLFVIFPFEVPYFRKHDMEVDYFGNPLSDAIHEFLNTGPKGSELISKYGLDERPVVALLAGSRGQEIKQCLPVMLKISTHFPEKQFVVAGAPSVDPGLYHKLMGEYDVKLVYDDTYNLLNQANAAIVTSGTATLETALFRVPQVVIYKTGKLTYLLAQLFVSFKYFSLVNLILDRPLVKEILQYKIEESVKKELGSIFGSEEHREKILQGYDEIIAELGKPGSSARVADRLLEICS